MVVAGGVEFVTDAARPSVDLDTLAAEVEAVQRQLADDLGLPPIDGPLRIYLFGGRREFSAFVQKHIPSVRGADTAGRHGIFLLRQGRPYVFLLDGERIVRSLRHEVVHVVLNLNSPDTPIWIDEGLAQCYESREPTAGNDRAEKALRWDWLRVSPPDAADLAALTHMQQLSARAYAGCWQHVRGMLADEEQGRPALRAYFAALRDGAEPPDLTRWDR